MSQQGRGRFARRALATIGVAALALLGVAAGSSASYADGGDDGPPTAVQIGNIIPGTKGSITVHKFEEHNPPGDFNPDGTSSTTGFNPLNGVQFTLYKVNGIDLTTQAGWVAAQSLTVDADGNLSGGYSKSPVGPAQETSGGIVTFGNLDIAVYVVMEGNDNGNNNITTKAAPFIVTVPLPNANDWLYNVHVYPKNSVTAVNKTVTSPGSYGLGSTVTWPITVKIPTIAADASFSGFSISDQFDTRLEYVSYTLVAGVDPVPNATPSVPAPGTPGGTFSVDVLGAGGVNNAFLKAHAGQDLVLTLTTKVVGVGTIVNDLANVTINGNTIHTPEPFTRWGDVVILKTNQGTPAKPLSGATFQVYDGACSVVDNVASGVGSPIPVNGQTTFTSGPDGKATIAGLWISDSVTNPAATQRQYCVIETGAPAGFNIKAPGGWNVMVQVGATQEVDLTVDNPQKPPVELPLTGSTGTAMFVAGGIGLLVIAAGASLLAIRRRQGAAQK